MWRQRHHLVLRRGGLGAAGAGMAMAEAWKERKGGK
jgi:hypothetical protein